MRSWRLILCVCAVWALAFAPGVQARFPKPANPLAPGRSALVVQSPFGLSIEYPLLERALGTQACPSAALISTLRELGSPTIRIGGDSQDLAGPTAAYHYDIGPLFWTALGCLARETGAAIVVGLNFATNSLEDQQAMIAAAELAIPAAQLSFSLGNEPDLYTISHIIPNEPGFIVPSFRSPPWTAGMFVSEWQARRAQLGAIRLEGPDLAGTGWRAQIERALRADPPSQVDAHGYPTVAPCGKSGLSATAAHLLSAHASVGMAEKLSWLARTAHAIGRPAVISETNSASCGGRPGVSDAPVSEVWAIRYVIAALLAGFQQVRFHSAGTSYDPLVFSADGSVTMRPLGKALLFLHHWLPVGSRIVSISHDPRVLAVKVTSKSTLGYIYSSFATKPIRFAGVGAAPVRLLPNRIFAVGVRGHSLTSQ
ncbi:MAG TPA: hypothetical protein VFR48_10420 [Solirubrobacteraceae bacterium]|nr:hypothetical protein [Solirubrobacteraceae bacterium]